MRVTASSTRWEWPCAVSTTIRSQPAAIRRSVRSKPSSPTLVAAATRRRPCSSLQASGILLRLLDVLDRDEADAAVVVVHHHQLLDAVLVQQALGLLAADALLHRDQLVLGHQVGDRAGAGWRQSARRGWSGCRPACRRGRRCGRARPRGCRRSCGRAISSSASASGAVGWMVTGLTTMPRLEFLHLRHLRRPAAPGRGCDG